MAQTTDYSGAAGLNFFDDDPLLGPLLRARLPAKDRARALRSLSALGELCGGRLGRLIEAAHREGSWPRLERWDRWGRRTDAVLYCAEQLEARRLAFSQGCLPPTPLIERMAKAYLLNQNGEGGVTCPLAMTDGLIQLLESAGAPRQRRRWLPLLRSPRTEPAFCAGQYVTERQGGSNVSENETAAEPAEGGSWRLTGLKWFCSNPGELWVTTAKPRGSDAVALFVMPRVRPDGELNDCHVLRLKDLSGTRGKATAEVEYRGAYAEIIGRPAHGLALLLGTVLRASRVHVAAGSLGMLRRALVEARLFASSRRALGRLVGSLAHARRTLDRLEALWTAGLLCYFEELAALENGDPAADVLVPLLKIELSRLATEGVRQARLLMAGGALLRDFSILPRLAEDALAQETWEGTHPVLAGHVLRALRRPASRRAFLALARPRRARGPAFEAAKEAALSLESLLARLGPGSAEERALEGLAACGLAWKALATSQLLRQAGGPLDAGRRFAAFAETLAAEPAGL